MVAAYRKDLVPTHADRQGNLDDAAKARIQESLAGNGLAIIQGMVGPELVEALRRDAAILCYRGFGGNDSAIIRPSVNDQYREFRAPFLASEAAVRFLLRDDLLDLLETALGEGFIVHNGVLQYTLPRQEQILDYHIDCGGVKSVNGGLFKVRDHRVRSILYLTDVSNGGFSYILNTAKDALDIFMATPEGQLFPPDRVPADPDRAVTVNAPAGTVILFDTHGLHRAEIPRDTRLVLNTWFARRDFSVKVAPTPINLAYVPPASYRRLHLFAGARDVDLNRYAPAAEAAPPLPGIARRLRGLVKSRLPRAAS